MVCALGMGWAEGKRMDSPKGNCPDFIITCQPDLGLYEFVPNSNPSYYKQECLVM